ncbi:MAG TPA: GDP-mannose 4,6-dehydratase [Gammaproteobacteria bacterium]|nr:GDP-mannose 4,6-dehydratase [Gammaproteobacteria bacterium]
MATVLVTGCAGFIGFHTAMKLTHMGHEVIGLDNFSDYYDVNIKEDRAKQLNSQPNFRMHRVDISQYPELLSTLNQETPIEYVIHLAAQAGVRYSIENPTSYVHANIQGQLNLLEWSRTQPQIKHFVYASSSSVYGRNTTLPFSPEHRTDHPMSFYAVSKKSTELQAECYAHLFNIPLSGLRYFTVYGPWGRPDMAAYLFTQNILDKRPIKVFNFGKMQRNFSYIDDIVAGTIACLFKDNPQNHSIYNLGNDKTVELMTFIQTLEKHLNTQAIYHMEPIQPGDVPATLADISSSQKDFNYQPTTDIDQGLKAFTDWYKNYYNITSCVD